VALDLPRSDRLYPSASPASTFLLLQSMNADLHSASVIQESRSRIFDLQPETARILDFQQVSFFCGNYVEKHLALTYPPVTVT
jgi:hypothetical protein